MLLAHRRPKAAAAVGSAAAATTAAATAAATTAAAAARRPPSRRPLPLRPPNATFAASGSFAGDFPDRPGGGAACDSPSPTPQDLGYLEGSAAAAGGAAGGADAPSPSSASSWRRRWTVVALCFVAFMLCNMDRVNMSVAILPMREQYGWDPRTVGLVQSSFFWGYLLTQVLGGVWADKYGGKLVLGLGVLWWSLATALTPIAASAGLVPLLMARCLMGVGEGVAMPAMNGMLSRWVPVAERSRSLALVYSGMFVGSIVGLALSPQLIARFGWPSVFYGFGSLGVLWYGAWQRRVAATPSQDPEISREERAYILANTVGGAAEAAAFEAAEKQQQQKAAAAESNGNGADPAAAAAPKPTPVKIPWKLLLSRKEVWAIIACHFCHNWGTFILLTWMPTYYNQVLGCDVMRSGVFSVLPWLTMAVAANVGGWLADSMVAKGVSVTTVRKAMQTLGFLGPAFFLSQLPGVTTVPAAVACMMGAQGFDAFSQSGLYSNHQDIGPRYAGVLLGMSNTAGVLAGVLGSLATGHLLSVGTWADVWRVAVALYLVGTVIWLLFSTGERIFD
jgi:ACS family sodium-dependent inorganic phosphate cotransporter